MSSAGLQVTKQGSFCFDVSVVPDKVKQLLLILKGTWLFITEVIYLHGTCFRGILRKEGFAAGLFSYGICVCLWVATLAFSTWWKCLTNRCIRQVWLWIWDAHWLFCPSPTLGLSMRLWEIGEASPHLHSPLGFAKISQGTGAFAVLWNHPIPWNILWMAAGPEPNAFAPFKGSGEVTMTQSRLLNTMVLGKQPGEGWDFLISHAFVQLKLFPLRDSQTEGDKASNLGWICELLFACGHICWGGNHCKSVSSLGSLRPWWTFTWCGSNFIMCSEWKRPSPSILIPEFSRNDCYKN